MKTFGWEPTDEELNDMVNVIDADGDGDISFNEFVWLMTRWKDGIKRFLIKMLLGSSKMVTLKMRSERLLECLTKRETVLSLHRI